MKKFLVVLIPFVVFSVNAQQKKDVLFTVDNEPIYSDEFLRVFNKNRDIVEEENRRSVEDYLELYVNYKLKLKQAYAFGLDTVTSYKRELEKYREQLIQPYLKDSKVTNALVKEAYNRMLEEVNASHILVRLNPKASPKDTLMAYKKIMEARTKVLDGRPFEEVAKDYSEDPSAQKNGGDLGYFTAFSMVYPFENAAYTNEVGAVSMPFKTSFGYHIIKVKDKRPSQGEVEVAHIMVKNKAKDSAQTKKQINDIYAKLQQGDTF
ncbi:MAG: peptidylprolyl isomerase, partial [Flavobacteriaceae bacterium]|nr:peptidylprolyl isomerase [Flavobacteriaceae bacterium]